MNILQNILGTVFPPYKFSVLRKEQTKLFSAIISALPDDFATLRTQFLSGKLFGLKDWDFFPDYKFVAMFYAGETIFEYQKRGQNFKITGLQIFSIRNNQFENVELLIRDNLIAGLKITNSAYQLKEFELLKVKADHVVKSVFTFPSNDIDIFYEGLNVEIKQKLNQDNILDIEFNNRIYYTFYDLEDGNYLAVNKNLNVYSLVHDAKPKVKRLKFSFIEILNDIQNNKFDKEKHLEERYSSEK